MRRAQLFALLLLGIFGCSKSPPATPPAASPQQSETPPAAEVAPPIAKESESASATPAPQSESPATSFDPIVKLRQSDWGLIGAGHPTPEQPLRPTAFEQPRGLKLSHNNPAQTTHLYHKQVLEGDYTIDVYAHVDTYQSTSSDGNPYEINVGMRDVVGDEDEAMLAVPIPCNNEIEHHFRLVRANGSLSIEVDGQSREVTNAMGVERGHLFFLIKNRMDLVLRRCDIRPGSGPADPAVRNPSDTIVELGGRIMNVVVGEGGRFVVATVPSQKKLKIVDLAAGKLHGEVPITEDALVAAGREKLVTIYGKPQTVETFELSSLKSLHKVTLPTDINVLAIAMGSNATGPLMTVFEQPSEIPQRCFCNLEGFQKQLVDERAANSTSSTTAPIDWHNASNIRASSDGQTFFVEAGEYYTFRIRGDEVTVDSAPNSNRNGPSKAPHRFGVALTENGMRVHYSNGVWSGDRGGHGYLNRKFVVPSITGDLWAELAWNEKTEDGLLPSQGNQLTLHRPIIASEPQTLELEGLSLDLTPWHFVRRDVPEFLTRAEGLAADQRLLIVPNLNRVATIPESSDKIVLRTIDLGELPPNTLILARQPPLTVVSPGESVQVKLDILSSHGDVRIGANGRALPGFEISNDGTVLWNVPENQPYGEITQHVLAEGVAGKKLTTGVTYIVSNGPDYTSTPFWETGISSSKTVPLESPLADVAIGGGGQYVVIHQPAQKRLRVFDTHARDWLGQIEVPEPDLLLTAGKDRIIIYLTARKCLAAWSLPELKPIGARSLPSGDTLSQIGIGSRSTGPLYVVSSGRRRKAAPELYDATSLLRLSIFLPEYYARKSGIDFEQAAHMHVSGDGRFAAMTAGRKIRVYQDKDALTFSDHDRLAGGPLMLGAQGHGIFGAHGKYGMVSSHSGANLVNAIHSPESRLFLVIGTPQKGSRNELSANAISIAGLNARSKSYTVNVPDVTVPITAENFSPPPTATKPYLLPDKRVIFLPLHELLLTIPMSNDSLQLTTLRPQDFRTFNKNDYWYFDSPLLPAEVEPGTTLEHQFHLSTRRKVTYELIEGPDGASLDYDGKLVWQVPTRPTPKPYKFKFRISNARGDRSDEELYVVARKNTRRDTPPVIEPEPEEALAAANKSTEILLDEIVQEIIPAARGRYLLLRLKGERRLHVLDVTAKKIIREIPLPSETALFAAGVNKLVIVDPATRAAEIHDLETWKITSRPKWPLDSPPLKLAMGSLSEGPLGVLTSSSQPSSQDGELHMIDLDGFRHRLFRYVGMAARIRGDSQLAASANGGTFTYWPGNTGGSGSYQMVRLDGDTAQIYDHSAYSGYLLPSANGDFGCTDMTTVRFGRAPPSRRTGSTRPKKTYSVPSVDGMWHVSVETEFDVPRYPVPDQIGGAPQPPIRFGIRPFGYGKPLVQFNDEDFVIERRLPRSELIYTDRQIHFIPEAKRLVLLPPEGDRVFIRELDLEKRFTEAKAKYFGVTSAPPAETAQGSKFEYQIKCFATACEDLSLELMKGPSGAQVDERGVVSWQVPPDALPAHEFSVRIKDSTTNDIRHEFSLRVIPRAVPLAAADAPIERRTARLGNQDGSRITVDLPERYESFVVGGRGRFLVLRTATNRLIVLDLQTQQISGSLPIRKQSLFTAGASCIVVADLETKRLTTWSLPELKELKSIPLPIETPSFVAMGCAAETPIWLGSPKSPWLEFYDARTLEALSFQLRSHQPTNLAIEPTHNVRASADGMTLAMGKEENGHALELMQIRGDGVHLLLRSNVGGFALPNFDGSNFLVPNGTVRFEDPVNATNLRVETVRLPAVNSDMVTVIPRSDLNARREFEFKNKRPYAPEVVVESDAGDRVATILDIPVWPPERHSFSGQAQRIHDQELVFVPSQRLFVAAKEDRKSLLLYRFDANRQRATTQPCLAEQPPRWADAGSIYETTLAASVEEGAPTIKLDLAPAGMTLSDKGVLRWEVPTETPRGEQTVSFTLSDAKGKSSTHSFSLYIHSKKKQLLPQEVIAKQDIPLTIGIDGLQIGGGGRFIFVHSKSAKRLSIVDLQESKVVKTLRVDDPNVLFAAGMEKLVVVLAQQRVMARWDLGTLERDALKVLGEGTNVASIALGSNSTGPLFLGLSRGSESKFRLLDVETLTPLETTIDSVEHVGPRPRVLFSPDHCVGVPTNVHASADGRVFTFQSQSAGGAVMNVLTVNGDRVHRVRSVERRVPLLPSGDGEILYERGQRFGPDLFPLASGVQLTGSVRPAETGTLVISHSPSGELRSTSDYQPQVFRTQQVLFYNDGDNVPLWQLDDFDLGVEPTRSMENRTSLPLDQRLYYIHSLNKLVVVPHVADRLIVWDIDVEQQLRAAKKPFLWITSRPNREAIRGQAFAYSLRVISDATTFTYKIESGPVGMNIDASGKIQWPVPAEFAEETQDVVVSIRSANDREALHTFSLKVVPVR